MESSRELDQDISLMKTLSTNILSAITHCLFSFIMESCNLTWVIMVFCNIKALWLSVILQFSVIAWTAIVTDSYSNCAHAFLVIRVPPLGRHPIGIRYVCPSVRLPVCPSINTLVLPVCLSICLSVRPSTLWF